MESYREHPTIPWPGEAVAKIRGKDLLWFQNQLAQIRSLVQHFLVAGGKKTGLG